MAGSPGPNFTVGNVHVSAPLTNLSIGYHPTGLIAEQVAPVIKVVHENDLFYVWDKSQAFRRERGDGNDSQRADKTSSREANFGATLTAYQAYEFAMKSSISDRERANADSVLQLETSKVRRIQDLVLLDQEIRVANLLITAANYASTNKVTLSGTGQWNNASFASQNTSTQSVIKQNVDTGKEAIRQQTGGLEANLIVIPAPVARVMARDVGIFEQVKYTHPDLLVGGYLPQMLWGMKVLVPTGVYDTSLEGETASMTDIWGKNVVILYQSPSPALDALSAAYIFRVRDWQVKTWRDEELGGVTYYEPSLIQTEKFVANSGAYLISAAIA